MPTAALVNIAVLLILMIVIPFVWPDTYPVRPWVMIALLLIAAAIALVAGAKWRRRGWDTEASRKIT